MDGTRAGARGVRVGSGRTVHQHQNGSCEKTHCYSNGGPANGNNSNYWGPNHSAGSDGHPHAATGTDPSTDPCSRLPAV